MIASQVILNQIIVSHLGGQTILAKRLEMIEQLYDPFAKFKML